MNSPFHFPSLVWDHTIAVYLFLLGISAGAAMLAVLLKRAGLAGDDPSENNVIRCTAFLAPLSIIIGLVILIFHLTKPWTFWYLMFNYSTTSIMSMGVMLFQVYMLFLMLWLAIIFHKLVARLIEKYAKLFAFVNKLIAVATKFTGLIEIILIILSVLLGAYTGFLLSALISYPMLNNPVLPILFLASGTSSGVAALIVCTLLFTKEDTHSKSLAFIHKFEVPVVCIEIFLLAAFFIGLYLGGGQKTVAFETALLSGFWANVFWIGVVGIGLVLPLILNAIANHQLKHTKGFMVFVSCLGLIGVLCLRFFILYAGQMTLA
ncbi:cytochrome c nitrite reductase subunit NrfD [Pasteurella dagmatis]|uniref:Cytochrome c nitrite reductase, NrfD subunit n=1 Tax=Pasteurella dagmatis ATCC 43325 TaxID=667128 RepID=C9PN84_9PAST|nr:cytochrome c nitrite reductase subunit NrfD [Pasteurella dagmatis]EEX50871.1 cytochrome c nitrite reductase, NrfD subunit [Pasteurella dagmatis ATCC 43325]SNV72475.1 cytochrome c nitrite reductase, NrfD subunit [Pasteurella dagmatis]